jgi:hypothetical protein
MRATRCITGTKDIQIDQDAEDGDGGRQARRRRDRLPGSAATSPIWAISAPAPKRTYSVPKIAGEDLQEERRWCVARKVAKASNTPTTPIPRMLALAAGPRTPTTSAITASAATAKLNRRMASSLSGNQRGSRAA